MKKPGLFRTIVAVVAAVLAHASSAQVPSGSPGDVNIAIIKLFGTNTTFNAAADVQVLDRSQREWARTAMGFTVLDGKIRMDVDMGQIKSAALPADAVVALKRLNLDRLASIARPDKRTTCVIYPGTRSYVSLPMSKTDAAVAGKSFKLEKTPLGRETVDGHPCVKNRSRIRNQKGTVILEATTWNAADLRDFPIRVSTIENGNTTILNFRQVAFTSPDAKLFEVPAGFTRYSDPPALMLAAAKADAAKTPGASAATAKTAPPKTPPAKTNVSKKPAVASTGTTTRKAGK